MTYKLLIVDDELPNLRLLERLFRHDYFCLTASSAEEAIQLLEQHDVATIITDQRMPQLTGIELLKRTAELRPHMVRILLTGYTDTEALVEAINCGLVYMYVTKPWNNDDLKLRVNRAVEHYVNNKKRSSLEIANQRLEGRISTLKSGFVRSLAEALKIRDASLYEHSVRVAWTAERLAKLMHLDAETCGQVYSAALLHDVDMLCQGGETACRHNGLNDNSQILADGWSGIQMFAILPEFTEVTDLLKFQQENYDGSGIPRGLSGDQIPLGSRIIRVAAQYDLLRHPRTSVPFNHAKTIEMLTERSGGQFDSQIVQLVAQLRPDNKPYPPDAMEAAPQVTAYSIN